MEQDKKIIAAIAAVSRYLEEEQAALAMQSMGPGPAMPAPVDIPSAWGLNGRQSMMQMRNLMQMRTFSRLKV